MNPKTPLPVFFKLTILLIIGILLHQFIHFELSIYIILVLLIYSILLVLATLTIWNVDKRLLVSILVSFSTILLGFSCMEIKQLKTNIPNKFQEQKSPYLIEIQSTAKETDKTIRYLGNILNHKDSSLINESVILYVSKQFKQTLAPNEQVFAKGTIQRIPAPKNPNTFHYQHFMDKKDIHFQTFLSNNNILSIEQPTISSRNIIKRMRAHCQSFISNYISPNQQAIAKALLIGDKTELNYETQTSFQRAGTTHILAVSGLHVGIIYIILQFFFTNFSKKIKLPSWFILLLLIFGIWAFVLVTGAKPSTIRAGFMFTLFGIGRQIRPKMDSINILAAVAFIMLCLNPFYLTDVGFQLSFSAVAGILLFQPFVRLFLTRYWLLNFFISISLISIIAQLSTIPFVIFYFHNTPLLGVFSNLVAIPAAFVIVSCGFLGILSAQLPFLPSLFGKIVSHAISILNYTNNWVSQFDFATIKHFQIQPIQVALLCIFFFAFLIHLRNRSKIILAISMLSLCLFFGIESIAFIEAKQQSKIYFYSLSNNLVIDIQQGQTSHLISQKEIHPNDYSFTINANHKTNRIKQVKKSRFKNHNIQEENFYYKNGILQLKNQTIQIINDSTETIYKQADYHIGYPLKTRNILKIKDSIRSQFILHHRYYKKQENDSNIHNLAQDGAYVINW